MASVGGRISLIVAALAVVLALYTSYWWRLSDVVAERVVDIGSEWREAGFRVQYAGLNVSGYPYRLQMALDQVDLKSHQESYDVWLNVPNFKVTSHPWNLKHWVGIFETPFQLGANFLKMEVLVKINDGRTSLVIGKTERPERFSLQLNDVVIGEEPGELTGRLDQLQLHIRDVSSSEREYDVGLLVHSLIVHSGSPNEPHTHLDGLVLESKVRGPVPTQWEASSLHNWRTQGGILDLQRLHLSWQGVDVELSGTVALDHLLRPIGAATATIEGYGKVLTALNKSGLISGSATIAATLALDLLSTTSQETGRRVVQAPITVQDGILSVGPIGLMHVGALAAP